MIGKVESTILFAAKLVASISTIAFGYVLSQLVSDASFGIMMQALSIVTLLAGISTLGLNRVLLRQTSRKLINEDYSSLSSEISMALCICSGLSIVVMLIAISVFEILVEKDLISVVKSHIFLFTGFSIPLLGVTLVAAGALKAVGRPAVGTMAENSVGYLISVLLLCAAVSFNLDLSENALFAQLYVFSLSLIHI